MAQCGEVRCDVRSVMRCDDAIRSARCEVRRGVRCGAAPVGMQRPNVGGGVMRCAGELALNVGGGDESR
jgi:hypothetical protein